MDTPEVAPLPVLPAHLSRSLSAVLASAGFRFLWLAQFFSQLADKFLMYALLVLITATSHIASAASLLMIAYTFPSVFLSTAAGVFTDRSDKRVLMLLTNLIRAGVVLLIPLGFWLTNGFAGPSWWLLIPLTLLFSSVGQFFAPAEAASIPALVPPHQIVSATSFFTTTVFFTLVLGVPLGAIAISQNSLLPFYIGAALFFLAGLLLTRIRTSLKSTPRLDTTRPTTLLREFKDGLLILRRSPALRIALTTLALTMSVVFTIFVLGPGYMTTVLHRSPGDTYLLLVPSMLGLIATAALVSRYAARYSRAFFLALSVSILGLANLGFAFTPHLFAAWHQFPLLLPLDIVYATIFGAALGCLLIPAFTVLQEQTDDASRGRVFGSIFAVINLAIAVPLVVAGGLADLFHSDLVPLAALGFLLLFAGLIYLGPWRRVLAPFDNPAHSA